MGWEYPGGHQGKGRSLGERGVPGGPQCKGLVIRYTIRGEYLGFTKVRDGH